MRKINRYLSILTLAVLVGCSTTSGVGPDVSRSGFDGARKVNIDPHSNACEWSACTGLGAQWSSATPAHAILIVSIIGEINAILGAKLSVDGKEYDLTVLMPSTTFNEPGAVAKESRKAFAVPLDLIRKITTSQRTWLRVLTPEGHIENAVIDGQTDSKAYHALKRFLIAVNQG